MASLEALYASNMQVRSQGISDLIEDSFALLSEDGSSKDLLGFWCQLFFLCTSKRQQEPKVTAICHFIARRLCLASLATPRPMQIDKQFSSVRMLQSIAAIGLARSILACGLEALLVCGSSFDPFCCPSSPMNNLSLQNEHVCTLDGATDSSTDNMKVHSSQLKESLLLKATDIAQTVIYLTVNDTHEIHLLCSTHIFARLCIFDRLLFFHRRCLLLECHLILQDWTAFFLYYDAIQSCLELSSDLVRSSLLSPNRDCLFLTVIRAALLLRLRPSSDRSIQDQDIQSWCRLLDRSLQDHLSGPYRTLCNLLISSPFVHADQEDSVFYSLAKQRLVDQSSLAVDGVLVDPFVDHLLRFA